MALDTYANLQTSIESWLELTSSTALIPDFIALAESEMNVRIKHWRNTPTATVTFASAGLADLPEGFRAPRSVRLSSSPNNQLEIVSTEKMVELLSSSTQAGSPEVMAVDGDNLRCWPTPSADTNAVLRYYRTIPALSDLNPSNWVLTNFPNAYLFGALACAFSYHDDTENEAKFAGKFEKAIAQINREALDVHGDAATPIPEATTP